MNLASAADSPRGMAPPGGPAVPAPSSRQLVLFGAIFAIFYFLLLRPQQRQKARARAHAVARVKRGDRVVTTQRHPRHRHRADEHTVTLRVADQVKLEFDRTAIGRVVEAPGRQGCLGISGFASGSSSSCVAASLWYLYPPQKTHQPRSRPPGRHPPRARRRHRQGRRQPDRARRRGPQERARAQGHGRQAGGARGRSAPSWWSSPRRQSWNDALTVAAEFPTFEREASRTQTAGPLRAGHAPSAEVAPAARPRRPPGRGDHPQPRGPVRRGRGRPSPGRATTASSSSSPACRIPSAPRPSSARRPCSSSSSSTSDAGRAGAGRAGCPRARSSSTSGGSTRTPRPSGRCPTSSRSARSSPAPS